MFADAFASIAADLSAGGEGPFHAGAVLTQTEAVYAGGSIVTPGQLVERACLIQGDAVTEAMRQSDGYQERDVRLIVIRLQRDLDTDARVRIDSGPHAGLWSVQSAERDPVAVGWVCRGRAG